MCVRRTGRRKRLRIRYAFRRAEYPQKLIALALNPSKYAKLLKNHRPGNDGKEEQEGQDSAGDPSRLFKDIQ